MPDGRRTVVGVRLSDDDCERLDAMRGEVSRAEFAYAVIKNAIGGIVPLEPDPPVSPPAARKPRKAPVPQAAFSDPPVNPLAPPGPETRRCTHAGVRITGGWCTECQWTIEPGGRLAARQR